MVAEPFTSWVLEDDFSDGRPPLEDVDVLLVDDVTPYELMKLRLLNASHQSLCYFAYLGGYRLVHDAAGDPLFAEFLMRVHGYRGDADADAGPRNRPARLQAHADRAVRQPRRDATPSPGCASARRTASRNGCFRWSARTSPPAGRSGCRRRRSPAGRATPRASTSRASRSTSRINWPTPSCRWPVRSTRTRPRSSRTPTCSAISPSQQRFVEAYLWALESLHRDGARATLQTLMRKEAP